MAKVRRFRHTIKIRGGTYPVRSVRLSRNLEYKVDGLILDYEDIFEETLEKDKLIGKVKVSSDPLAAALSIIEMLKGLIRALEEKVRIKNTVEDFVIKHAISPEDAKVLLVCLGDLVDRGIPPVEIMKTMKRIKSRTWRCVIPIGICTILFGDCNECPFDRNKK